MSISNSVINVNGITDYMIVYDNVTSTYYRIPPANLSNVYSSTDLYMLIDRGGVEYSAQLNQYFTGGIGLSSDAVMVCRSNALSGENTLYSATGLIDFVVIYELTATPNPVNEGIQTVAQFTTATDGVYYWHLEHVTTNDADFETAPPNVASKAAFTTNAGTGTFDTVIRNDSLTEGSEIFVLHVSDGGLPTSNILVSTTVTVNDTSQSVLIAEAGPNQSIIQQDVIVLQGSYTGSVAVNTISWNQLAGPNVVLNNASTLTPDFTVPNNLAETLIFEMTLNSGESSESSDTVSVFSGIVSIMTDTLGAATTNQNIDYSVKPILHRGAMYTPNTYSISWSTNFDNLQYVEIQRWVSGWVTDAVLYQGTPGQYDLAPGEIYRVISAWGTGKFYNASNPLGKYTTIDTIIEPGYFSGGEPNNGTEIYDVSEIRGIDVVASVTDFQVSKYRAETQRYEVPVSASTFDSSATVSNVSVTKYAGAKEGYEIVSVSDKFDSVARIGDITVTRFNGISIG